MNAVLEGVLMGLALFATIFIISIFFRFWGVIWNGIFSFFGYLFKKTFRKKDPKD